MTLTREQIEKLRGDWQEQAWPDRAEMDQIDALCDLALVASDAKDDALRLHREKMEFFEQNIAMREAIKRAEQDLLGIHVKAEHSDKLRSICARLVQSLNPKNEEKS